MSLVDNKVFVKMGKGLHGSNVIIYRIIQGVPEIVSSTHQKTEPYLRYPDHPKKINIIKIHIVFYKYMYLIIYCIQSVAKNSVKRIVK